MQHGFGDYCDAGVDIIRFLKAFMPLKIGCAIFSGKWLGNCAATSSIAESILPSIANNVNYTRI